MNPYIKTYTNFLLDEYEEYTCACCGIKKSFLIQKSIIGNQCIKHRQHDEEESWQLIKIDKNTIPLCPDCYFNYITVDE